MGAAADYLDELERGFPEEVRIAFGLLRLHLVCTDKHRLRITANDGMINAYTNTKLSKENVEFLERNGWFKDAWKHAPWTYVL